MFRILVYAIIAIFLITVFRMIAGVLARGVGELFQAETAARSGRTRPPKAPASGALKRDPVCGAYIPSDDSVRKTVGNEVVYFCSTECRDKYSGTPA